MNGDRRMTPVPYSRPSNVVFRVAVVILGLYALSALGVGW